LRSTSQARLLRVGRRRCVGLFARQASLM
jgi:hypothetical protein